MEASLSLPELLSIQPALTAAPSTDAELVFRVRAGDEAAFEQLYLAYHDRLWKFAFGEVRASEIAEELVQDVFLALWRDRARWDVRTSVRAWLYAAVRHHARNHRRHERVAARFRDQVTASSNDQPATSEDGGTCMGNTAPGAQVAMEAKELDEAVVRAVAALPERRRIAMTLRWKHDLSAAEIAQVLDTTPEAVRVLLTRARQELGGLRELARG